MLPLLVCLDAVLLWAELSRQNVLIEDSSTSRMNVFRSLLKPCTCCSSLTNKIPLSDTAASNSLAVGSTVIENRSEHLSDSKTKIKGKNKKKASTVLTGKIKTQRG